MGNNQKKQKKNKIWIPRAFFIGAVVAIAILCIVVIADKDMLRTVKSFFSASAKQDGSDQTKKEETKQEDEKKEEALEQAKEEQALKERQEEINKLIEKTDYMAKGYFYDEAVQQVEAYKGWEQEEALTGARTRYLEEKEKLIPYDGPVNHVFFHSLIADTSKAFDGDGMSNGYNYWMTTISEFNKMLEQMHDKGFVLVSIHDVAGTVEKDGKKIYQQSKIYLPEGKKPFVLSQDDVSYYDYMQKDGFAKKIVLDKNGKTACQIERDGKIVTERDFDVVPLLDVFVEKNPDFSYRGAKGLLALTGYEGTMGYRVDKVDAPDYEKTAQQVKKLAKALKVEGWEFASHGYGHRHSKEISADTLKKDTDRWEKEIGSLIGGTDVYVYPYGEEIEYKGDKLDYLMKKGFRYYCGVYAYPWIEINKNYVRMTRRNLDGFTMHFYPDRIKDLFDLDYVYDQSRQEFK